MKFILAWLVTLLMASALGLGMLLAVKGDAWLLVAGGIAYLLAFARFGCLPSAAH